ncbi:hypothetical protein [Aquimarina intermedia]|uniref:DUF3052 family protein n=1 Tax=Aquimarina intermedia TaxID=350814 RepID=A0A5S5C0K7_9FLAO|nr:hypothetical protein [Aquimarina intermedia]TYP72955.1 hypothetical protein BD809_106209 [Aquimarina intermedia]
MTTLFKKLKLPSSLDEILILNEPEGFASELDKLQNISIKESLVQVSEVDFAIVFVTDIKEIENRIETLYPKLIGDAILWFAHPNQNSKRFISNISSSYGWGILDDYDLIAVKKLAINKDWEGIRFRKATYTNPYMRLKQKFLNKRKSSITKTPKTT